MGRIHMSHVRVFFLASSALGVLVLACGPSNPQPAAPNPNDPYAAYYPPPNCDPSQPGCAQQPQWQPAQPQPAQPYPAPQPQPQPGYPQPAPAPSAGGAMATPGPFALPCQNDSACIMARCNMQYGKCAFPCQTAADCATGASCNTMSGLCLPGGGQ